MTDRRTRCKGGLSRYRIVAALVVIFPAVAGACGSEMNRATFEAPSTFVVSSDSVRQIVAQAISGDSLAAKLDGTPTASCPDGTICEISYTLKEPAGVDNDVELILPTRQIWKTLFTDTNFQSGTIRVSGPVTTVGGKTKTDELFALSCDRAAAQQIDWDKVDGNGLRQLCNYNAEVKGM